jgi:tRNA U34 2-thiouridine synthase MnmA/TrmU
MKTKALVLLSGGLDSVLTIGLMLQQGIEIEAIHFITSFCSNNRIGYRYKVELAAEKIGVRLRLFNIFDEMMEIIKYPKHGHGKGMNPCIDCHTLMLKKAKEYMLKTGASFIATGEVLGQRPMSQHSRAMELIEKESGLEGLLLRPLSAKLLKPTIPEQNGWIDREKLLDISGRSRKYQLALAKELLITEYSAPAGGCLLTDSIFARKMKDLLAHTPDPSWHDIQFLKIGRHFRLSDKLKLVVARNEEENEKLLNLLEDGDTTFMVTNQKGPLSVCRGEINQEQQLAAAITARYSDDKGESGIVMSKSSFGKIDTVFVQPMDDVEIGMLRI